MPVSHASGSSLICDIERQRTMKVVIIGNSGSGKTWLARELSSGASVPLIRLDEIFWEPGGFDRKRSSEDMVSLVRDSKLGENWVVEGVFGELAKHYLDEAEILIWLDLPWRVCKARLLQRGSESKQHMSRDQSEQGLQALLAWASGYYSRTDLRSHEGHKALFNEFSSTKVWLKDEPSVQKLLVSVKQFARGGSDFAAAVKHL
jgi:adenylate kinase family enzyme